MTGSTSATAPAAGTPPPVPTIPDVTGMSTLDAAFAYGRSGLYIVPVRPKTKAPGGYLGKGWPSKSVRTGPDIHAMWEDKPHAGIGIHAGRSGLVVVDVDKPDRLDERVRAAIIELAPPFQVTRRLPGSEDPAAWPDVLSVAVAKLATAELRGHAVFQLPPGRMLGNGLGKLTRGWGDIRGRNGFIVTAPSPHEEPDGEYRWLRTGAVPYLPSTVADELTDASGDDGEATATDEQVAAFKAACRDGAAPHWVNLVNAVLAKFRDDVDHGEGRHTAALRAAAWMAREAAAGQYSAGLALADLRREFTLAVSQDAAPRASRRAPGALDREFDAIEAWAVGQAITASPQRLAQVRERLAPHRGPAAAVEPRTVDVGPVHGGQATPVGGDDAAGAEQARAAAERRERELGEYIRTERYRRTARQVIDAEADAEQDGSRRLRLTPGSKFKIRPVRWVWAGRMPVGEITLIPGREGAGKSTFLAWQASAITRGMLPGMWEGMPRGVLYAATEDSWEYTIAPRMIAAGADMDRVFRIDVEQVDLQAGTVRYGKLSLPVDVRLIAEAAADTDAAVLMCDPVISIIDDRINTFKAQELRGALEPLKRAVEEAGIALAGLVHFNKTKDTDVLSMISGSRAWPEVARAVIAIAVDKDADEYTCVVSQVKNNLGRSDLPHLKYTIDTEVLRAADHPGVAEEDVAIGRLRWTGESERGAEEILQAKPDNPQTSEKTQGVVAFLRQRAAALGGPVPMARLVERFVESGAMTENALKLLLRRAVDRGEVLKPSRGMYAPGLTPAPRPCPGCGRPLEGVANWCGRCARHLDAEDVASRDSGDRLF